MSNYSRWSQLSIFLISFVVVSQQLLLMRTLSVTHYYHFSYLVISTALLGFGASGTFLSLAFDRLKNNFPFWSQLFCLLFLISLPVSYTLAQNIPLDTQYVLYSFHQFLLLSLYNLLLFLPFFFGGTIIGYMLSYHKKYVPGLYGADLIGSGVGGVSAVAVMMLIPTAKLPVILTPLLLIALVVFMISALTDARKHLLRSVLFLICGLVVSLFGVTENPDLRIDQYKELARFEQLESQNDANRVADGYGPRGQIDIFESETFHYTLFAGLQAASRPPDQFALLIDGITAGAVFRIDDPEEAAVMDYTPQSLPYKLLDSPRVLLLGEITGTNIWLAKRFGADKITVVQSNPEIISLLGEDLNEEIGAVFNDKSVDVVNIHPRLFIEQKKGRYDLIHLVTGESMATGTGGLQGLNEDYVLTRESIQGALSLLEPGGMISVTRGIQSPPRDNIKLVSLFSDAYRTGAGGEPSENMLISRNYLAANILLSNEPISESKLELFLDETANLQMDTDYYPGITPGAAEQINVIEGPEGKNYSWIHHAAMVIFSGDSEDFRDNWVYKVDTPTDDSPYFYNFFTWDSLQTFLDTFGDNWFQRLELGYVLLVITFLQLSVAAFILILLPLILRYRTYRISKKKLPAFLHFLGIGIGFMFLEITFIQKFTRFLGDPVYSASAVLSSLLVFSGLGSILQEKINMGTIRKIQIASGMIILLTIIFLNIVDPLLNYAVNLPLSMVFILIMILLMPLSFFMGWMFPGGMSVLEKKSDTLIPWAWGVNGFASVAASPLAIILSMSFGFNFVILTGLGFYLLAGFTAYLWNR